MPDKINILPDSIANQIAAGEVIQRPASVVKELVENAIDADSENITINIKDAGKTIIQVTDDGLGMSETDARMAFERHSTSKIKTTEDLFSIFTKGFRGEALASISSIAQTELKTKREPDELGTQIIINGAKFISQENITCKTGSNFIIKNLFFNIPARRKFLKGNTTELKHIITEIQRIAIPHPNISIKLIHNNNIIYQLPISKLKQRLMNVFDKNIAKQLIPINVDTNIIKIFGFIGKPELAKKKTGEQFFFVNNRYMRNAYFNKAISLAYDQLIPRQAKASYFIFFEIEPNLIDINIHPTKTEINFEDANAIFQILMTSVKNTLAKHNITPSIDFDTEGAIDMRILDKNKEIKIPEIEINPNYNPFENESNTYKSNSYNDKTSEFSKINNNPKNWKEVYEVIKNTNEQNNEIVKNNDLLIRNNILIGKNKYIITTIKSGLMIIDKKRAHERILYENFYGKIKNNLNNSQQLLYPFTINLQANELIIFNKISKDIEEIGFKFEKTNTRTIKIQGIPSFLESNNAQIIFEEFIENSKHYNFEIKDKIKNQIAILLSKSASINRKKELNNIEMRKLIDELFACSSPNYTAKGKKIIFLLQYDEIDKMFL